MRRSTVLFAAVRHAGWAFCLWVAFCAAARAQMDAQEPTDSAWQPAVQSAIDQAFAESMARGHLPGGVVWMEQLGSGRFHRAYGQRAVLPQPEVNDEGTLYDAASLTKVIVTAPLVHLLREAGQLDLDAPVRRYLPDCVLPESITLRLLLNHHGGLPPSLPLAEPWSGPETALKLACAQQPRTPPGQAFVYSDIDFILLGAVVAQVAGQPLEALARDRLFAPLGMRDSGFLPLQAQPLARIAPTEKLLQPLAEGDQAGQVLRGVVHDPTARRMGGVAGHAGLFTTSADVARYARMLLRGGLGDEGTRVLSEETVALMSQPASPAGSTQIRSLGWDMDTAFSSPRGELYPKTSYGHTGFTGNALWIDPGSHSFFVLLSNRVHPQPVVVLRELYGRLGTLAAQAAGVVR